MTPDPYTNSGRLTDPQSWNRYAYTRGDPVNRYDPNGMDDSVTVYGIYTALDYQTFSAYTSYGATGGSYYAAAGAAQAQFANVAVNAAMAGFVTDFQARTQLNARLQNFASSNCAKIFAKVIQGFSTSDFTSDAQSDTFYAARGGPYSKLTQNQAVGNGVSTTLSGSVPYGWDATTIWGPQGTAVLLGPNYFTNTNSTFQENALLHEALHGYTEWNDVEIFSNFAAYGLQQIHGGTIDITDWLSNDCKKTDSTLPSALQ